MVSLISTRLSWACLALALGAGCARGADEAAQSEPPPAVAASPTAAAPEGEAVAQKAEARPSVELPEKKFGEPITVDEITPLEDVLASPDKFADKTIRTEGVVTAVCKSMGCWMELSDEKEQAHVTMAGHSFFVPKTADGHRAIVQGTVTAGKPEDQCGNKDGCYENAQKATGKVAKLEIVATGVEFVD
jgi:hypothetical protein